MSILTQKVYIHPDAIYQRSGRTYLLFDPNTREVHTLNETASFIFGHCRKPIRIDRLLALLTEEFSVDRKSALRDVTQFLRAYSKLGFLKLSG